MSWGICIIRCPYTPYAIFYLLKEDYSPQAPTVQEDFASRSLTVPRNVFKQAEKPLPSPHEPKLLVNVDKQSVQRFTISTPDLGRQGSNWHCRHRSAYYDQYHPKDIYPDNPYITPTTPIHIHIYVYTYYISSI